MSISGPSYLNADRGGSLRRLFCDWNRRRRADSTSSDIVHPQLTIRGTFRPEVTDDLNEPIDRIVANYPLRGFDAIHLASALMIHERIPEHFVFACFDRMLIQAAQTEGLKTLATDQGAY